MNVSPKIPGQWGQTVTITIYLNSEIIEELESVAKDNDLMPETLVACAIPDYIERRKERGTL